MKKETVITAYNKIFKGNPRVFRSPARINLIGGHTDYNDGFALPMAIDKAIYFAIDISADADFHLYSLNLGSSISFDKKIIPVDKDLPSWVRYLQAILLEIQAAGKEIQAVQVCFGGDIPIGAGISSSAALTCGFLYALNEIFDYQFTLLEIAQMAMGAEHRTGVKCGIMDQYAILFSKKDHVILLDCLNLTHNYVPVKTGDYCFVLYNSNVPRSLVDSEFNKRATACREGFNCIHKKDSSVKSIRDIDQQVLEQHQVDLTGEQVKRLSYIVGENRRVEKAGRVLLTGDNEQFGKLLYETHSGLSEEYEISCPELDFIVEFTKQFPEVAGARLVGGGFGGCVLAMVREQAVGKVFEQLAPAYFRAFGLELSQIVARSSDGISEIL